MGGVGVGVPATGTLNGFQHSFSDYQASATPGMGMMGGGHGMGMMGGGNGMGMLQQALGMGFANAMRH